MAADLADTLQPPQLGGDLTDRVPEHEAMGAFAPVR